MNIAYFISPHGLGHAARAASIMAALSKRDASTGFEIFSKVAPAFFRDSHVGRFGYHSLLTDIGIVQQDSLNEDIGRTVKPL
jgi:hypothetical protein